MLVVLVLLGAAVAGLGTGALLAGGDAPEGRQVTGGTAAPVAPTASPTPSAQGSLSLGTSTGAVDAGERLTLSGQLVGGEEGARVVVQRREEGGWADFPASTTTGEGGRYDLEVSLGRPGENLLRTSVPAIGAVSEPVAVEVG
ncbi:hypothetical protein D5H78_11410 [Vallicoccus soli]|uniref:Bacterial spore germination immunoglobulin-like domain-containing protein n=1 Tax=Vallicoccus soli TaxID=2339232 RepID=A0A3A3YX27_9ACTN|nr:hypothetical protein D5H78_11410 [Vallicoccus soli]